MARLEELTARLVRLMARLEELTADL